MSRKIALVLSGGGAKGAFQLGALKYIYEELIPKYPEFRFSIIAGVSVGSLNGVMLAQNKYEELLKIWENINNSMVYKGKISLSGFVWRLLKGKNSLLSHQPLKALLNKHVHLENMDEHVAFRAGTVSLLNGEYYYFNADQFSSNVEFRKAILASALMPVIWEPVASISSTKGIFLDMVDGGIRNNSPLRDVLDLNPEEVVIINCSPFKKALEIDEKATNNIFQIAKRSLVEIAMNEIFIGDLKKYLKVNELVKQAQDKGVELQHTNGKAYRYFKTVLINPEAYLGDVLNFEQHAIQAHIAAGNAAARKAFENYKFASSDKLYTNLNERLDKKNH